MNYIKKSAAVLAIAAEGSPVATTIVVMLFSSLFHFLECTLEVVIWGERFVHFLDPILICAYIAYSACAVLACATYNTQNLRDEIKKELEQPETKRN